VRFRRKGDSPDSFRLLFLYCRSDSFPPFCPKQQAHIATLTLPTAAHTISRNHRAADSDNTDNANRLRDEEQLEAQADGRASLVRWMLRLHLALFYLNGRYPTLAHRLAGVRVTSDAAIGGAGSGGGAPGSARAMSSGAQGLVSPAIADRPSYRLVGALILLEAGAALTGALNRLLVEMVHRLELRRAARRSRTSHSSAVTADAAAAGIADQRSRLLDRVEQRAPSVLTYEEQKRASGSIERVHTQPSSAAASSSCGICMHDRQHPAAPTSCGHVFCWGCIVHWSTRVRPECPLCRAPAKPQDIVALYNY